MYVIGILNYHTRNAYLYVIYDVFVYKCIVYIAYGNGHLSPVAVVTICAGVLPGHWAADTFRGRRAEPCICINFIPKCNDYRRNKSV